LPKIEEVLLRKRGHELSKHARDGEIYFGKITSKKMSTMADTSKQIIVAI